MARFLLPVSLSTHNCIFPEMEGSVISRYTQPACSSILHDDQHEGRVQLQYKETAIV